MKKGMLAAGVLCAVLLAGCRQAVPSVIEELAVEPAYTAVEDAADWYYIENSTIFTQQKNSKAVTALATLPTQADGLPELQVAGEYLYFSCDAYGLYRIPVSGGEPELLLDTRQAEGMNADTIHSWVLLNGKIYIQLGFPIFCYDIGSRTLEKLVDDAGEYALHDGGLYYIPHDSRTFTIYRLDLQTGKETILLGDGIYEPDKTEEKELYKSLVFAGDDMYYFKYNPDGLYRYRDGQSHLLSAEANIDEYSLCVCDGALYYIAEKEDGAHLMRCDNETGEIGEQQRLANYAREPVVKNGYVYYRNATGELLREKLD